MVWGMLCKEETIFRSTRKMEETMFLKYSQNVEDWFMTVGVGTNSAQKPLISRVCDIRAVLMIFISGIDNAKLVEDMPFYPVFKPVCILKEVMPKVYI